MKTQIINAHIITMEYKKNSHDVLEYRNGYIEFKDGIITNVADMQELREEAEQVIDVKGGYVVPGFIEGHCHMGVDINDITELSDPITPQMKIIDSINPTDPDFQVSVAAGITSGLILSGSSNVIGGQGAVLKFRGKTVEEMLMKEGAVMKAALGTNPPETHGKEFNHSPYTRMGIAALLRDTFNETLRYMNKKDKKDECFEKNAKYEALIPVMKREIPMHIHAHRSDDIMTGIRICKEFNLRCVIAHATGAWKVAKEISESDARLVVGPMLFPNCKPEMAEGISENIKHIDQMSIPYAFCTDGQVIRMEDLPMCASAAVANGVDEYRALAALTIESAKMIGVEDRIGSLKIGKDADIVVFDKFPLEYTAHAVKVFIDGELLVSK